MAAQEEFTLDHPFVQEAKRRFNARSMGKKWSLSFDDLFLRFQVNCNTLTDIGIEVGVTRERIRQVYNSYFRSFFAQRSGNERQRACTIASHAVRRKIVWRESEELREVGEKALAEGYSVEARLYPNLVPSKSIVRIAGKICSVHTIACPCRPPGAQRYYAHTNVRRRVLKQRDMEIFLTKVEGFPERLFIIPSNILSGISGEDPGVSVYLPLERRPVYRNNKPNIDYWQYENAWHLLKDDPS